MAEAGFFWCGSENQPDLVRCFVCLKEFEDWEKEDNPRLVLYAAIHLVSKFNAYICPHREEHKRLCPQCPYMKLGKTQGKCTVKEVLDLCQKSLSKLVVSSRPPALHLFPSSHCTILCRRKVLMPWWTSTVLKPEKSEEAWSCWQ